MVKINNICKTYGENDGVVRALTDCSLEIKAGGIVSVIGKSGSGKSTLLNIIGGLLAPDSGQVIINGVNIMELSEKKLLDFRRDHIGYVYQSFNLIPELTAEENIKLPLYFSKKALDTERYKMLVSALGLNDRLSHKPSQLSGGQQQRVAIARALLTNPDVLLCDEPTGNLDSNSAKEVMTLLHDLNQNDGKTIIIVTHDNKIAQECDHIITIADGRVAI